MRSRISVLVFWFSPPPCNLFLHPSLRLSCTCLPRAMRGRSSLVPAEVRLPSNPSRSCFSQTSRGDETRRHIVKYVNTYRVGTSECVCQAKEGEGRGKKGDKNEEKVASIHFNLFGNTIAIIPYTDHCRCFPALLPEYSFADTSCRLRSHVQTIV